MGAAIFPAFERKLNAEFGCFAGKCLSANLERLDELAAEMETEPLSSLLDARSNALNVLDEDDPILETLPPVQWHPAEEGLAVVRKLIAALRTPVDGIEYREGTIRDLHELEQVLVTASATGIRFHLLIDM